MTQQTESGIETNRTLMPEYKASDALSIWAEAVDDLERTRIATENRLRALSQRGEPRDVAKLEALLKIVQEGEHTAIKGLERSMRNHVLGPWVKATVGIGLKQGARLLAELGDVSARKTVSQLWAYCGMHVLPADHRRADVQLDDEGGEAASQTEHETQSYLGAASPTNTASVPNGSPSGQAAHSSTVAQGEPGSRSDPAEGGAHTQSAIQRVSGSALPADHRRRETLSRTEGGEADAHIANTTQTSSGVAPRRTRGQKANWNNNARMRVRLIAESCIKHRHSPSRSVYDQGREKYAEALHSVDCAGCKAKAGEPLTDGHKHARALRLVAKAILRDIWIEARAQHSRVDQALLGEPSIQ